LANHTRKRKQEKVKPRQSPGINVWWCPVRHRGFQKRWYDQFQNRKSHPASEWEDPSVHPAPKRPNQTMANALNSHGIVFYTAQNVYICTFSPFGKFNSDLSGCRIKSTSSKSMTPCMQCVIIFVYVSLGPPSPPQNITNLAENGQNFSQFNHSGLDNLNRFVAVATLASHPELWFLFC